MRLGLCCLFRDQPIKFATTTATSIDKMKRSDALAKFSRLCMENADALLAALRFCADNGIGCFRINSQILPIKTHPNCGYEVDDLPESDEIVRRFRECGQFVRKHKLRTCFHPDQFVVLNSPRRMWLTNPSMSLNTKRKLPSGSGLMSSTFMAAGPTATSRRHWPILHAT